MPVELELVVILVTVLTGFASATMERQALLLPSADAAIITISVNRTNVTTILTSHSSVLNLASKKVEEGEVKGRREGTMTDLY